MPDEPERTAIDDLLDRFVESLRPPHERRAAAPSVTIEVRKTTLREAAQALLEAHEHYLVGAAPVLSAELSREQVDALIARPHGIVRLSPDLTRMQAADPLTSPPADPRPAPEPTMTEGAPDA